MPLILGNASSQPTSSPAWVKDVNMRTFMADVVEASQHRPVLVDFWAQWCGPCKQLTPTLERLVEEFKGDIYLAKINADENQQLAQQLHVQSLPTVYAFFNRQPVDAFSGNLPESHIRAFCKQLVEIAQGTPERIEKAFSELNAGNLAEAQALFMHILKEEPTHHLALVGMARCYLATNDIATAEQYAAMIPDQAADDPAVKGLQTALALAEKTKGRGGKNQEETLREKLNHNPHDLETKFDLALALYGQGDAAAAVDQLLEIMRTDQNWQNGKAKSQLIEIFEGLGFSHSVSVHGRRALAKIIFA